MRQQQFASPEEAVAHFGTKGMRWGIRKERETTDRDSKAGVVDPISIGIGAVYVAIFLAATYRSIRIARVAKDDSGKKVQIQNADVPWKKNPALTKKMNVDTLHTNVVKPINPSYPATGTKMNCRRATFAYEMRRRGNDVTATRSVYATGQDTKGLETATMNYGGRARESKGKSGWGENQIASPQQFASNISPTSKSTLIYSALSKHPEGARGELAVGWEFGGGHSVAWEVVGGKAVIFDTQNAKTYRKPNDFDEFSKVVHDAAYTRTDNLKLDEAFLRRWMVNA